MLALATGAGLAAALVAYFGLARQTQGANGPADRPVAVVVAARALPARRPLTAGLLRVDHRPASQVPAGSVAAPEELAGQVTTADIAADQPVTREMVTPRSASPGMAWAIAPSRRAVTVALDPVSGVAGFLEPGDHVDVLVTLEADGGQAVTRTILQNARLLAIGTRTEAAPPEDDSQEKPASSATLEVTPREAQALALAAARGKLQLALRGLEDAEQPPVAALASAAVTGRPAVPRPREVREAGTDPVPRAKARVAVRQAKAPPPTPVMPPRITVIRGTDKTTVTVGE